MDTALDTAINRAGGPQALAESLEITRQAVLQWKRCPAHRVLAVEKFSGISRELLRPDLYPSERHRTA